MPNNPLPDEILVTFKRQDWLKGRRELRRGAAIGSHCALAQTLIREVNESREFSVGASTVSIYNVYAGRYFFDGVYSHDGADIVDAFDHKKRVPADRAVTFRRSK